MTSRLGLRAEAVWRALTYLSVAQVYLDANPLLARRLVATDVKPRPSGHWGTVPGTAWILAHLGLLHHDGQAPAVVPLLGGGHAGVVQRALAWLNEDLARVRPEFSRDADGLASLVSSFPQVGGLGSEVHPQLPAGGYVGGWLGGALAFAQGAGMDDPEAIVAVVVGDGECETPTTAAAWLAQRATGGARVLPVVHLNGRRMGGTSLLGGMSVEELHAYMRGLGWSSRIADVGSGGIEEHLDCHRVLARTAREVADGQASMVFLRCEKGWSGPSPAHKAPLDDPQGEPEQLEQLGLWLASYRPGELFTGDGRPTGVLSEAVSELRIGGLSRLQPPLRMPDVTPAIGGAGLCPQGQAIKGTFSAQVAAVLRAHARVGDFKVFSPDELASNRLGDLAAEPWAHELLAEEVLLGWLAGWTARGRRGLLVSYEAFAPLLLTGLIGYLRQIRLEPFSRPSLNLLLTSYGWHNTYTHGDPSLISALIATGDPAVRVYTPADPLRTAVAVDDALRSVDRVNVILAGKHTVDSHPMDTLTTEQTEGLAVWPHLSGPGDPDLTLVCAGDLPATLTRDAAPVIAARHRCAIRVVNVHELTTLATDRAWRLLGHNSPVLITTLGHPAAVWGLLGARADRPVEVIGWREPPHPMSQGDLAAHAGLDILGITTAAARLLSRRGTS